MSNDFTQDAARWQSLTGLFPDAEAHMPRLSREQAVRTLVHEVQRITEEEIARTVPAGERTHLYDPIYFICNTLGISRSKLSTYTRELTGMSAYELTDKVKARSLPQALVKRVAAIIAQLQPALLKIQQRAARKYADDELDDAADMAMDLAFDLCLVEVLKTLKYLRSGNNAMAWAAKLGYANPSRMRRACVLEHDRTVESFEDAIAQQLVLDFLNEAFAAKLVETPASEKIAPPEETPHAPGGLEAVSTAGEPSPMPPPQADQQPPAEPPLVKESGEQVA